MSSSSAISSSCGMATPIFPRWRSVAHPFPSVPMLNGTKRSHLRVRHHYGEEGLAPEQPGERYPEGSSKFVHPEQLCAMSLEH